MKYVFAQSAVCTGSVVYNKQHVYLWHFLKKLQAWSPDPQEGGRWRIWHEKPAILFNITNLFVSLLVYLHCLAAYSTAH